MTPPRRLGNDHPGLAAFWHPVAAVGTDAAGGPWPLLGHHWDESEVHGRTEHLGLVWIAPEAPRAALPAVVDDGAAGFVRLAPPAQEWRCDAARMTDNFADVGHLPFVHAGSFADPDDVVVPRLTTTRTSTGCGATYHHSTRRLHGPGMGRRTFELLHTAPFCVVLRLRYHDDGATLTTLFAHQPIDVATTRLHVVLWRDDVADGRCTPADAVAFQQLVAAEDRAVLEAYREQGVPLDPAVEVHTRADRPTVEVRRVWAGLFGDVS